MTYTLDMREECGGEETLEIEAEDLDAACALARQELRDWAQQGDYGDEGGSVLAWWSLEDEDGDEVASGQMRVAIEPDHDALIRKAGGDPTCDHEWISQGEGGCDENPGVWSLGGTAFEYASHCRKCGLRKREVRMGAQRNPGEHDTVEYTQPDPVGVEQDDD